MTSKLCIVCLKEIYIGGKGKSETRTKRGLNSRTCSRKCSKIYIRITQNQYGTIKRRILREMKKSFEETIE